MNMLTTEKLTMSSREIAELTGKRHPDVKRDIKNMLTELSEDASNFAHNYIDGMNRNQIEYMLDKDHTECLLTGYSAVLRMKVIKRWHELESSSQPKWLANVSPEALVVIEDLNKQLESASHEVDRLQGVCNTMAAQFAPGMTAPKFCKQLNGVNTSLVNTQLVKMNMLNRSYKDFVPTSYSRDRYFAEKGYDHDGGVRSYAVLTMKGAKWLYRAYLSNKLPMKKSWDNQYIHLVFEGAS